MRSRDSFEQERDDLGSSWRRKDFFAEEEREAARRSLIEHHEAFLASRNGRGLTLRGDDQPEVPDGVEE
jgi:hypothetical protein